MASPNTCSPGAPFFTTIEQTDASVADGVTPPACVRDDDCRAGFTMDTGATVAGKCVAAKCNFDACLTDADCATGYACTCQGNTHAPGNVCLKAQCRVDADCGPNGLCSESSSASPFYGITGRYCRTPKDTCHVDSDCGASPQGSGTCVYDGTAGYWACSYDHAAG
jgi:hypothetical protein